MIMYSFKLKDVGEYSSIILHQKWSFGPQKDFASQNERAPSHPLYIYLFVCFVYIISFSLINIYIGWVVNDFGLEKFRIPERSYVTAQWDRAS